MDWGKKDEFVQAMYRRAHSAHSRRFYETALRKFSECCAEKRIGEVNAENVYAILNSFVEWNDARGIRSKVNVPRATRIDEQPLTITSIRVLVSKGRPKKKMMALILTLLSSGMRIAEALNLKIGDLESRPSRAHIKAEYSKTRRDRWVFISDEALEAVKEILSTTICIYEPPWGSMIEGLARSQRKKTPRIRDVKGDLRTVRGVPRFGEIASAYRAQVYVGIATGLHCYRGVPSMPVRSGDANGV
jgi:integrase